MRLVAPVLLHLVAARSVCSAPANPVKPSASTVNAVVYTAYNQEESGGKTRISLTIKMTPQGKVHHFTGVMTFVRTSAPHLEMKGT